eukprot:SAG31_NODE_230_length_19771_cov_90.041739_2_plen_71_part_00
MAVILLISPVTRKFIGKLHKLQKSARKETDGRVKYVLECMTGIRILKFMCGRPLPLISRSADLSAACLLI